MSALAPLAFGKTNLGGAFPDEDVLVWFGHHRISCQIDGKKILVDPAY